MTRACVLGLCLVGAVNSIAVAEPTRHPQNVPDSYIPTPVGWYHPSCVNVSNDRIDADTQELIDGNGNRHKLPPCAYPHFKLDGSVPDDTGPVPGSGYDSWDADAYVYQGNGSAVTWESSDWVVPAAPSANDGQTIFLWNGANGTYLVQPVLEWLSGRYRMACWNVIGQTTISKTNDVTVYPGDTVSGYVYEINPTNYQCGYNVNGSYVDGRVMTTSNFLPQAIAADLESFGVYYCHDFPASGGITFNDVSIFINGYVVTPGWSAVEIRRDPLGCLAYGGGISATSTSVSISWVTW